MEDKLTYKDIEESGGLLAIATSIIGTKNMCVRADEIDDLSTTLWLPTFCNVTSNEIYERANQMVTFDSLDIAEIFPINLSVNFPTGYTSFTIDGIICLITYPNGAAKRINISRYDSTLGTIPISNCAIDGAEISVLETSISGAYVKLKSTTGIEVAGEITLNSQFAAGKKVKISKNNRFYSCFTITKAGSGGSGGGNGGFEPVVPDIGDFSGTTGTVTATTTRTIDVILNNVTSNVNNVTLGASTYASGTTSSNFGPSSNMTLKLNAYQGSTIPIGNFAGTTLVVPKDAYVQIKMGSVSYSQNTSSLKIGMWDSATKVVSPGVTNVEFTFSPGVIEK